MPLQRTPNHWLTGNNVAFGVALCPAAYINGVLGLECPQPLVLSPHRNPATSQLNTLCHTTTAHRVQCLKVRAFGQGELFIKRSGSIILTERLLTSFSVNPILQQFNQEHERVYRMAS